MRTSWLALLGSALYATTRYNILKGVPWDDWPTYTLNKAFALSALVLLVVTVIHKRSASGHSIASTLSMAGVFGFTHVILSSMLLSPAYYEKFFVQGKLTAVAGLSMAIGAVAAAVMGVGKGIRGDLDPSTGLRNLAVLAFVVGLHAMLPAFGGWLTPTAWPGLMPPITLIAFLLGLMAVLQLPRPRKGAGSS